MTFATNLKPDAFVKRRLVSGSIWLELDGVSFPGDEWDDFPVVTLGFWLTNIQPLLLGKSTVCECPFMDGPYQFNVEIDNEICSITLVDRATDEEEILVRANVDFALLVKQMLSASEIVVDTCKRNHWIDADLLNLEKLVLDVKPQL